MSSLRCNLEVKARLKNLEGARVILRSLCERDSDHESQTDTFFIVAVGRLKLREIEGRASVLIWYERPNVASARLSHYHLVPIPDPTTLKLALSAALGVRGVVRKRRDIFLWHNIRIHLDQVEGLDDFVEFEAVLTDTDRESEAHERLTHLALLLGLDQNAYCACAYADLLGI